MKKIDIALRTAGKMFNLPYRWGGNDPNEGFDCSGLVIEILQSCGLFSPDKDTSAHGLSLIYPETEHIEVGCLAFWDWNKDGRIDHVEFVVAVDEEGEIYTIGASGGNDKTSSLTDAMTQNAYVKCRPLKKGAVKFVNPFKIV